METVAPPECQGLAKATRFEEGQGFLLVPARGDATRWAARMNRRQFLEALAVGLVAAPTLASPPPAKLPQRLLGRTGIKVPILGFGSGSRFLMYQDEDKAMAALHHAIDLGITYIDTAHSYGDGQSEERVGRVMATRRKEVTLSTKIAARTADEARRQIERKYSVNTFASRWAWQ